MYTSACSKHLKSISIRCIYHFYDAFADAFWVMGGKFNQNIWMGQKSIEKCILQRNKVWADMIKSKITPKPIQSRRKHPFVRPRFRMHEKRTKEREKRNVKLLKQSDLLINHNRDFHSLFFPPSTVYRKLYVSGITVLQPETEEKLKNFSCLMKK
jgi:hypothetical protein